MYGKAGEGAALDTFLEGLSACGALDARRFRGVWGQIKSAGRWLDLGSAAPNDPSSGSKTRVYDLGLLYKLYIHVQKMYLRVHKIDTWYTHVARRRLRALRKPWRDSRAGSFSF